MSFSRWSTSVWYTYWSSTGATAKEDQEFAICGVTSFTYKQISEDIEACLTEAATKMTEVDGAFDSPFDSIKSIDIANTPTKEELEELRGYMLAFIRRVDNDDDFKERDEK